MACRSNLVFLSCAQSGCGFTSKAVSDETTRIRLMRGHGKNFPKAGGGLHYYITVEGCNTCCELMRVIDKDEDTLIVERGLVSACSCIGSNAKVTYNTNNVHFFNDINNVIPLNVISPLRWDCETNTLSVDCAELFKSGCGECGCEEGSDDNYTTGGVGLRGEKGEKGDTGPGIVGANVSPSGVLTFVLDNGESIVATGRVPRGPRGEKGDNGATGSQGDAGTSGEATTFVGGERRGTDMVLKTADDQEVVVKGAFPTVAQPVTQVIENAYKRGNDFVLVVSGKEIVIANAFA